MVNRVKICAPDVFEGDAVGNHCLGMARMARRLGYEVAIYAQNFEASNENISQIENLFLEVNNSDVLIISYSIFDKYLDKLLGLSCKKICYFHGITTPELLERFDTHTAKLCHLAGKQINQFIKFDAVICNSKNTSLTLKNKVNPYKIKIIPPVFSDMSIYKNKVFNEPAGENLNFLMVGRCVPHKNIEFAIEVLAEIINCYQSATMTIVGSTPNYAYLKFLINKARNMGVLSSIDFTGTIHDQSLATLYGLTTGLMVTSLHEGFSVPVLEAMRYGKPVFILGGTAAEELDIDGNVFSENNLPQDWVGKITKCIRKNIKIKEFEQKSRMKHAMDVLHLTDDLSWNEVLNRV